MFKSSWDEFREVITWLNEALRVNMSGPIHKAWCGYQNYIVTDFKTVFEFSSDWRIADFKSFSKARASIVVPTNPRIERILGAVEIPGFKFSIDKDGFHHFIVDAEELELPHYGDRRGNIPENLDNSRSLGG